MASFSSKVDTHSFVVQYAGRVSRINFDTSRTLDELHEHICKEFELCQCRLVGLRPGKREKRASPGIQRLSDFRLRNPQKILVIGTKSSAAMELSSTEAAAEEEIKSRGRSEEGWEFLYEKWQMRKQKEACLRTARESRSSPARQRFICGLLDGQYLNKVTRPWEADNNEPVASTRQILQACVAGGHMKLLQYCVQHHHADNLHLARATLLAASLGRKDFVRYLLGMVDNSNVVDVMETAILHHHLPLLEDLQAESRLTIPVFATAKFSVPDEEPYWPLAREMLVFLLRNGCHRTAAIANTILGRPSVTSLQMVLEICLTTAVRGSAGVPERTEVLHGCEFGLRIAIVNAWEEMAHFLFNAIRHYELNRRAEDANGTSSPRGRKGEDTKSRNGISSPMETCDDSTQTGAQIFREILQNGGETVRMAHYGLDILQKNTQYILDGSLKTRVPLVHFAAEVAVRLRDEGTQVRGLRILHYLIWKENDPLDGIELISHDAQCEVVRSLDELHKREVEAMNISWRLETSFAKFPSTLAKLITEYLTGSCGTSERRLRVAKVELARKLKSRRRRRSGDHLEDEEEEI
uniref:Uncharacterized protein n=1 Tax=Lotharella globosa TaxID=91324 RepID=A0A7S3YHL6_9EUKA